MLTTNQKYDTAKASSKPKHCSASCCRSMNWCVTRTRSGLSLVDIHPVSPPTRSLPRPGRLHPSGSPDNIMTRTVIRAGLFSLAWDFAFGFRALATEVSEDRSPGLMGLRVINYPACPTFQTNLSTYECNCLLRTCCGTALHRAEPRTLH